ncbi:MAG: hypothetical protein ABMA13_12685 [Chthoniobacteraceae bacterium]
MKSSEPLPYPDTKPVGAADFYFAINATFRFILARFGGAGLRRYWREIGSGYYAPVTQRWQGGLGAVAEYWRAFFAAEPGAEVEVHAAADEVRVEVKTCPMIRHLRENGREIVPCFCQHCFYVSDAIGEGADIAVRVSGGNGACVQRFAPRTPQLAPQDLSQIEEAR